jgi:hypothetical protein
MVAAIDEPCPHILGECVAEVALLFRSPTPNYGVRQPDP